MKKKIVSLVLLVALVCSLFSGCAGEGKQQESDKRQEETTGAAQVPEDPDTENPQSDTTIPSGEDEEMEI